MKTIYFKVFNIGILLLLFNNLFSQILPVGYSQDTVWVSTYAHPNYTSYIVYFYKPISYDSITSPILWNVHGTGGSGFDDFPRLKPYADRHNSIIVSATMHANWNFGYEFTPQDNNIVYLPEVFKQIYRHVLFREDRSTIPVYLTGFSAGGQTVSRYMLYRQGVPDSIPVVHAASLSGWSYTFCTEMFKDTSMWFPCGFKIEGSNSLYFPFLCNEHAIQYYNENLSIVVGLLDTTDFNPGWTCMDIQGADRLEKARTFFAFSDSNAINRGTILNWSYTEIPGIAHSTALYDYINPGDSIPVLDRLLFESPYHSVPQLAPIASFIADTTIVYLPNATVNFINNSINSVNYTWYINSNCDTATFYGLNPSYTFTCADTFSVSLTACNNDGCCNKIEKYKYIIVKNPVSTNNISFSKYFSVYPNPTNKNLTISSKINQSFGVAIYNANGQLFLQEKFQGIQAIIDMHTYLQGIYFIKIITEKNIVIKKIVKE